MSDEVRATPRPTATSEPQAELLVSLLGSMLVEFDGRPLHVAGRQRRRLLALLACRPGRDVSAEALIDAMWGDDPPPSAAKTVQSHVVRLRQSLAAAGDAIQTSPGGYRLNIDPASTDVTRFERLATEGANELRLGHFAASTKLLCAALELWRGPALIEFGDANFAIGDRVRLEERRLTALEDLAAAQLGTGAAPTVVPEMERVVAEHPGRERAWELLMRALYASGRQHDALAAYQRARIVLGDEFGLEPGHELRALEQRILEQDPTLIGPGNRAALPAPLRDDTPLVGRQHELAWLAASWARACRGTGQVRAVLGPSGSGRTRLVAELASEVISGGGSVEYVSGRAGLHLLADGPGPGSIIDAIGERCRVAPLLLVVDDVEWTPPPSIDAIRALATAAERLKLLLVMIGHSADGPGIQLIHELETSCAATLDLVPMSDDEIAAVILGEGGDSEAIDAAVAMAGGLPGIARREAAAWAERAAADRLNVATSISIDSRSAAEIAGTSVHNEVLRLVEARGRRSALAGAEWAGRQPYRSLATYESADADLFVGRERVVAELTARVLDRRLVAVVGASGSGKSSLVRAGLLPLVRSGRLPGEGPWRADVIVPGSDVLAAIETVAGLDEPGRKLLVIDQFEEVLSSGATDAVAGRLLDLVLDPAVDARIVLVIRADQLGALASSRPLAELIEDAQVLVGPPSDEELRRIVVEPARRTGCTVEPELVSMIAADVAGHDAALPLVSAAMAAVWERREGETLSAQSYIDIGGLAAAVERLGDRALAAVGPTGHGAMRAAMLRLVDVTDDGVWRRRRVDFASLTPDLGPAIDALVDARLVARTGDEVAVVHEVVFRAWPQMVTWLDEARVDLTLERDLRAAARSWDAQGRSDDEVLRGGRLQAATDWVARRGDVPPLIAELVEASRDWAERDDRAIRAQLAREHRSRRRLRVALVAASLLLVVALTAGMVAAVQRNRADTNRDRAEAARTEAVAQQQIAAQDALVNASVAIRGGRRDLAALLAIEAHRRSPSAATENALFGLFTQFPGVGRTVELADGPVAGAYFELLPDGATIAAATQSDAVRLIDVATGRDIALLRTGAEHPVNGWTEFFAATPDSRLLAVSITRAVAQPDGSEADSTNLSVWNVATQQAVFTGVEVPTGIGSLALSTNGRLLAAAGGEEGRTLILDATSGSVLSELEPIPRPDDAIYFRNTVAVVFMSDDRLIVTSQAGPIRIVDPHTGTERQRFESPGQTAEAAAVLAPDESWLLTSGARGLMRYDLPAGTPTWGAPSNHVCQASAVTPIGLALCAESGGRVTSIDLATGGVAAARFEGMTGAIGSAATPDGSTVIVFGDERYSLWRTDGSGLVSRVLSRSDTPFIAGYTADGSRLLLDAEGDDGPAVEIVDASTGEVVDRIAGASMVHPTQAPKRVIMRFADGRVGWYDLAARRPIGAAVDPGFEPADIIATADGALAWSYDGQMVALDLTEGRVLDSQDVHRSMWQVVVGPDGRTYNLTFDDKMQRRDPVTMAVEATADPVDSVTSAHSNFIAGSDVLVFSASRGDHYLLDPDTLRTVGTLPASRGGFTDLALDAGENRLLTIGADDEIRLYDLGARVQLGVGLPFSVSVPFYFGDHRGLALRPDGRQAAFAIPGGIAIWDLDPDSWVIAACELANRNLTREEWESYIGAPAEYHATCPQFPIDS
ncbi:MAG: BTAD domain-containing putative transcriptional regulator [Ilumatobacteraceae bacterium]